MLRLVVIASMLAGCIPPSSSPCSFYAAPVYVPLAAYPPAPFYYYPPPPSPSYFSYQPPPPPVIADVQL